MIRTILGKLAGPFMPYILGGAAAGLILLAVLLWQSNARHERLLSESAAKIERAAANNKTLSTTLDAQNQTIDAMTAQAATARRDQQQRILQLDRLQAALDKERQKNEDYKRRWEKVAQGKPELLSRAVNRAVARRVRFFSAATCRTDCDPDGDEAGGGGPASETRPDPGY